MCNILSLNKDITTDQKKVGRPGAQYIEQTSGPQLGGNLCLLPLLLGNTPSIASLFYWATPPSANQDLGIPPSCGDLKGLPEEVEMYSWTIANFPDFKFPQFC